jgi:hypothetical protein
MKYAHIAILSVAATAALTSTLPAHAQQAGNGNVDLVTAGVSVFNSIINPPHRSAEIQAEADIKKAKIQAQMELDKEKMKIEASKDRDPAGAVLTQWGVNRVSCTPGVVFVNGITNDTVCVNPTAAIPAGYYNYTADKNLLVRAETGGGSQTAPSQPMDNGNVQTASRRTTTSRTTSNRQQTTAVNSVTIRNHSGGF